MAVWCNLVATYALEAYGEVREGSNPSTATKIYGRVAQLGRCNTLKPCTVWVQIPSLLPNHVLVWWNDIHVSLKN